MSLLLSHLLSDPRPPPLSYSLLTTSTTFFARLFCTHPHSFPSSKLFLQSSTKAPVSFVRSPRYHSAKPINAASESLSHACETAHLCYASFDHLSADLLRRLTGIHICRSLQKARKIVYSAPPCCRVGTQGWCEGTREGISKTQLDAFGRVDCSCCISRRCRRRHSSTLNNQGRCRRWRRWQRYWNHYRQGVWDQYRVSLPCTNRGAHLQHGPRYRLGRSVCINPYIRRFTFSVGLTDLLHRWVFNTALPAADQTGHDVIYNPSESESFQSIPGAWFDVSYGDNSSTSGLVGRETVHIGTITVVGQAVELPGTVSPQFSGDTNLDGIVGLGFSPFGNSIRPSPMPTFFENAAPKLKDHVFTANLKNGIPGHYEFGTIDVSACKTLFRSS